MPIQNDSYNTISRISEGFYKEKGSKFYGFAIPCDDVNEAKAHIERLRKEHHNAVHVCFAWRFGSSEPYQERYSDDGEPNNSAGKPIFGQIVSFDLTNVLIAVVRYYGGTNLGVGGLINAYRTAAKEALNNGSIQEKFVSDYYKIGYDYTITGDIMVILKKIGAIIENQGFENNNPQLEFNIRRSFSERLKIELEKYNNVTLTHIKTT